jgi:ATP-dependent Clp protease ATP-binding subunit ClpA
MTVAIAEAGRRGDRRVATDHLLIGLLHDPAIAQQLHVSTEAARRAADRIDRDALGAIGVDAEAFGPLADGIGADRLPLTPGVKSVLKRTLAHTAAERARHIETRHLLQALLERRTPDPAAHLLEALRTDPDAQRGTRAEGSE